MIKDLIGTAFKGAAVVDKFHESGAERQATLSGRHTSDMASDNWLSKSIRPLVLLVLMVLQVLIVVLSACGLHVDVAIVTQHGVLLSGAFGFYFNSRKAEKVAAQNAKANIELEKIRTKHTIKTERKEARQDRKAARRAERDQDSKD